MSVSSIAINVKFDSVVIFMYYIHESILAVVIVVKLIAGCSECTKTVYAKRSIRRVISSCWDIPFKSKVNNLKW